MTNTSLKPKIGTPVAAVDGPVGYLYQVIRSPNQCYTVSLVVRVGVFPRRDLIIPADLIADVTEERVMLRVQRADLHQPSFDPTHYLPLMIDAARTQTNTARTMLAGNPGNSSLRTRGGSRQARANKAATSAARHNRPGTLQPSQPVWAVDGWLGWVDQLIGGENGQISEFVVHKGRLLIYDVLIPVDWIKQIDQRGVWLSVTRTKLDTLPEYRSDSAIAAEVTEMLWQDKVLRTSDIESIDVVVRNGVVILSGYTVSLVNKARAVGEVCQVSGVRDIKNRLVTDYEVKFAVAQALTRHPALRRQPLTVTVNHGVVILSGRLTSPILSAAAEVLAATVPQTRGILNMIQTPEMKTEVVLRILQPKIGQMVYAGAQAMGRVNWVVIHPRHRRVTALIVSGIPSTVSMGAAPFATEKWVGERQVVIPVEAVRTVGASGVMLAVGGDATHPYADFDPTHFSTSPTCWQPPYPYTHADVLLEATAMDELAAGEQALNRVPSFPS